MSPDNEDYEQYIDPYVCSYHRAHPDKVFSGCGCHSGFWMCRAGSNSKFSNYDPMEILNEPNFDTES